MAPAGDGKWHRVAGRDDVTDGAVMMAKAGDRLIALARVAGKLGALDNACPHMGGPLGQGAIENGRLVCPWHGRAYDPMTGACEGFEERAVAYPVDARDDGIYVCVEPAGGGR